jgi:hypothetical protein
MKTTSKAVIAMLALGASAWVIIAQENNGPADGQRPPRRQNMNQPSGPGGGPNGQGGPGMRGRRPAPPVLLALDANHDGEVDADEIAGASAALKKLDKDGDGKLSMLELMGPPPQGMGASPDGGQGRPPGGRPPRQNGDAGQDGPPGPPPGEQQ